jgi:tetratricopeptide (TPR) repeat protein
MNVCKTLAKWAFASLLLTGTAFAQMTSLEGRVTGEDGKPINGAEVKITRTDIKANYSVKTKKDGKYQYATLPLGTYDIQWLVDGKSVYEMGKVRTDYSKPIEINVDLAKIKAQQMAAAGAGPAGPSVGLPPAAAPPVASKPPAQQTEAEKKAEAEARARLEKEKADYEAQQKKNAALQGSFNTGVEAAKAKNYDAAIEAFKQAGEADPKQDAVWSRLGEVYEDRATTRKGAERMADYNAAVENFQKAIDLKPEDPAYRYHSSVMLARSNKLPEATAQLEKAVQLDPTQASRGYRNLGIVYFETNRSEPAEAAFKKAIELDPKNADAQFQLGLTLIQRATEVNGKLAAPAGTAEAFQSYLELAPTGANAEEAKSMLQVLGAPIQNSVGKQTTPAKPAPAKGKGK